MHENDIVCFDFRIMEQPDGTQLIDSSVKTPMDALTPEMQVEYMEVDRQLAYMDMLRENQRREAESERKLARNPIRKIASLCGLLQY